MTLTIDVSQPSQVTAAQGAPVPTASDAHETIARAAAPVSFVWVQPSDPLITAIPAW